MRMAAPFSLPFMSFRKVSRFSAVTATTGPVSLPLVPGVQAHEAMGIGRP